jgi:predicted acyl esterase
VRLCEVDAKRKSTNVCDGIVRVTPATTSADADGVLTVVVELWPTAYRFAAGHRLRVLVASGAHSRWVRNLGTDEPLASARTLCAADQEIFHDSARPSAIVLPVTSGAQRSLREERTTGHTAERSTSL